MHILAFVCVKLTIPNTLISDFTIRNIILLNVEAKLIDDNRYLIKQNV